MPVRLIPSRWNICHSFDCISWRLICRDKYLFSIFFISSLRECFSHTLSLSPAMSVIGKLMNVWWQSLGIAMTTLPRQIYTSVHTAPGLGGRWRCVCVCWGEGGGGGNILEKKERKTEMKTHRSKSHLLPEIKNSFLRAVCLYWAWFPRPSMQIDLWLGFLFLLALAPLRG